MTQWHQKHISTKWGVLVLGILVLATVILIPVLGQSQDDRSHAMVDREPFTSCTTPGNIKGTCFDIKKNTCAGGYYLRGYCQGPSNIQCCVLKYNFVITNKFCTVNFGSAHDLRSVAQNIAAVCQKNFPKIEALLETKSNYGLPVITLGDGNGNPAYTSGSNVTVDVVYLRKHPEDMGMIVHELTHVVQGGYPKVNWIMESMADYVRYELGYADPRVGSDYGCFSDESYQNGYWCGATLLKYVHNNYDSHIIKKLQIALHSGTNTDKLFPKSVSQLWNECKSKGYCTDHSLYYKP